MFSTKYRYIFIILLGAYSYLNIMFTQGDRLFGDSIGSFFLFVILNIMVLAIWEGNRFLERSLLKKIHTKVGEKLNQLLLQFIISLVNVVAVSLLGILMVSSFTHFALDDAIDQFNLSLAFSFRVNLFLHSVNAIIFYVNRYKEAQLEAEKMKKISIESKYEALINQVNPHFLFNSLNVLSSLVYKNQDLASEFIEKLSSVYRYLLNSKDKKLITLEEELDFIKSYSYLLKTRFQTNLNFRMSISHESLKKQLPPASIQLLFENAIKHNIISKNQPLDIQIRTNGSDYLYIENNYQPKESDSVESNGLGLINIRDRYRFFTDKEIQVSVDEKKFMVGIPLIEVVEK